MENWFTRRNILVLALVLVGAGGGTYLYQHQAEQKEQAGKALLFKAQQAYENEIKGLSEGERGGGIELDVDDRFAKTTAELKSVISRADAPSRIRFEAALRLGSLYLDFRHPDRALEFFKTGSMTAKSSLQKASADYLLGTAQEQSRMFKEAMESFQRGVGQNVEALKADFLLAMVRVSLQLKDTVQAKTHSDRLNKELPKSKAAETAKSLLKDLP
jgi:TolA-binding protein